jgi:N-acyl-D-amino-acid deacylase
MRQTVDFDVYPYPAGSTVLMPERVREDVPVRITWSIPHPEAAGRMLDDLARDWQLGLRPAAEKLLPAGAILYQMNEMDVQRILSHPRAMIGSDGLPHDAFPHPRLWGTFPRVLGHYARDLGLFPLERAVHKMTGLAAQRFGLERRGELRIGHVADITIFDPATIQDRATFDDPQQPSVGVRHVFVAGAATMRDGVPIGGSRPGRFVTSTLVKTDRQADSTL